MLSPTNYESDSKKMKKKKKKNKTRGFGEQGDGFGAIRCTNARRCDRKRRAVFRAGAAQFSFESFAPFIRAAPGSRAATVFACATRPSGRALALSED
jgi:hypothetical protein